MFVTVKEASKRTGYAHGSIRALASREIIQSMKEGKTLLVCMEDIISYMTRPRKRSKRGHVLLDSLAKQCQEANRLIAFLSEQLAKSQQMIQSLMALQQVVAAK
jgi:isoaspartyl peptidase/L-asparaginase-like protein (Ntn-hydrolase superfamily)